MSVAVFLNVKTILRDRVTRRKQGTEGNSETPGKYKLTVRHIHTGEKAIIKHLQANAFPEEIRHLT